MNKPRGASRIGLAGVALVSILSACAPPDAVDKPVDVAPVEGSVEESEIMVEEAGPAVDMTGTWEGHIEYGGAKLLTVFNISRNETGEITATVDSPDQNAFGIPVKSVVVAEDEVTLTITAVGAVYKGTVTESTATMAGTWNQGGVSIDLMMARTGDVDRFSRPQDPRPPFPYEVVDVRFRNDGADITLAGTITRPEGTGPFPGIVLVTGSGPQNRDEEVFDHRPFLVLADSLTRAGFAVLRYDDRGVAESEGDAKNATMVDLAGDAASARAFLIDQPFVGPRRVGFLGHSEGGITTSMIAADDPSVAFLVLLAATSVQGYQVLVEQNKAVLRVSGASDEVLALSTDVNTRTYQTIMEGGDTPETRENVSAILKEVGMQQAQVDAQLPVLFSPWYQHFLSYDPAIALGRLQCPVLALFGTLDIQVLVDQNLPPLEAALERAPTDTYQVAAVDGKNHLFQTATTGHVDEYAKIEETISPQVLQIILDWLQSEIQ